MFKINVVERKKINSKFLNQNFFLCLITAGAFYLQNKKGNNTKTKCRNY